MKKMKKTVAPKMKYEVEIKGVVDDYPYTISTTKGTVVSYLETIKFALENINRSAKYADVKVWVDNPNNLQASFIGEVADVEEELKTKLTALTTPAPVEEIPEEEITGLPYAKGLLRISVNNNNVAFVEFETRCVRRSTAIQRFNKAYNSALAEGKLNSELTRIWSAGKAVDEDFDLKFPRKEDEIQYGEWWYTGSKNFDFGEVNFYHDRQEDYHYLYLSLRLEDEGSTIEDYAVSAEAQEVAVQAEIDNAEKAAEENCKLNNKRRDSMSRGILIYGQPGSGKTSSLETLDPASTIIIDADKKGLSWQGCKQQYSREKKNYIKSNDIDNVMKTLSIVGKSDEWKHIKTIAIDGMNNVWARDVFTYDERNNTRNGFEKYREIGTKTYKLFDSIQDFKDDLNIIVIAHVETADPYVENDVDKIFTPGKMIAKDIKLEGKFNYVFYAKCQDGDYFFETKPNHSTARSPKKFPNKIPNDIGAAISLIEKYEAGELSD